MVFIPDDGRPLPDGHPFKGGLIIFGAKRPKPSAQPSTPSGQEKTPSESSEAEKSSTGEEQ